MWVLVFFLCPHPSRLPPTLIFLRLALLEAAESSSLMDTSFSSPRKWQSWRLSLFWRLRCPLFDRVPPPTCYLLNLSKPGALICSEIFRKGSALLQGSWNGSQWRIGLGHSGASQPVASHAIQNKIPNPPRDLAHLPAPVPSCCGSTDPSPSPEPWPSPVSLHDTRPYCSVGRAHPPVDCLCRPVPHSGGPSSAPLGGGEGAAPHLMLFCFSLSHLSLHDVVLPGAWNTPRCSANVHSSPQIYIPAPRVPGPCGQLPSKRGGM